MVGLSEGKEEEANPPSYVWQLHVGHWMLQVSVEPQKRRTFESRTHFFRNAAVPFTSSGVRISNSVAQTSMQ